IVEGANTEIRVLLLGPHIIEGAMQDSSDLDDCLGVETSGTKSNDHKYDMLLTLCASENREFTEKDGVTPDLISGSDGGYSTEKLRNIDFNDVGNESDAGNVIPIESEIELRGQLLLGAFPIAGYAEEDNKVYGYLKIKESTDSRLVIGIDLKYEAYNNCESEALDCVLGATVAVVQLKGDITFDRSADYWIDN
ncbi:MAG: hypothetical protein R3240_10695, partial [Gammaproteobacteria bacterium]|nr:hypothetical protein [Gammaproteobacteria bacterium]